MLKGTGTALPLSIHSSHIRVLENFHSTTAFSWDYKRFQLQEKCILKILKTTCAYKRQLDYQTRQEPAGRYIPKKSVCQVHSELSTTAYPSGSFSFSCFLFYSFSLFFALNSFYKVSIRIKIYHNYVETNRTTWENLPWFFQMSYSS